MKCFVTGGAGFIGSHLVDRLLAEGHKVKIFDNFSTGQELFIAHNRKNPDFEVVEADLTDIARLETEMKGMEMVFHLAGHADVPSGYTDHEIDHDQNLEMVRNVLESMYKNNVKNLMFASTSSVYGDAEIHPTPENYPFLPTSLYGAAKASAESYISAYSSYYGIKVNIFRFVSFIGERSTHGLSLILLKQLKKHPHELDLLSDGSARKSSIYIKDGIEAIMLAIKNSKERYNIYNIGHDEVSTISDIVDWIIEASGYKDVNKNWQGVGTNFKGDNEFVQLSNDKLKAIGWKATLSMKEGIKRTVEFIIKNYPDINI